MIYKIYPHPSLLKRGREKAEMTHSITRRAHLNIALGSCGEFHSCYESFRKGSQITKEEYEKLDELHYKVENQLLKLIESLQKKQKDNQWEDSFQLE